jgi:hypothetical protein
MDQIFGAVCLVEVAILFLAESSAIDIGVNKLKVDFILNQRIVFPKIFNEAIGVAVILITKSLLACNQKVTSTFSVFLFSNVIFIITEFPGLSSISSLRSSPSLWLMKMEGILTL